MDLGKLMPNIVSKDPCKKFLDIDNSKCYFSPNTWKKWTSGWKVFKISQLIIIDSELTFKSVNFNILLKNKSNAFIKILILINRFIIFAW